MSVYQFRQEALDESKQACEKLTQELEEVGAPSWLHSWWYSWCCFPTIYVWCVRHDSEVEDNVSAR